MVQQDENSRSASVAGSDINDFAANNSVKTLPEDDYITNHHACSSSADQITEECEERKAPDRGWGWFVVLGGFLVHFIMGGFERSSGVMYLQLLSRYNRSATATAWVLSIFSTLRLLLGPLASAMCNRFSCRFVVMIGAGISALGVLISGFVPAISYMYLTYGVLCGLGRALVYTPSVVAVGYYFNKRRGIAVGISTSGVGFGCFLFPPVIELFFNYYGYSGTFLILAAIISNFFVCGALFRPLELQWKLMEYDRRKKKVTIARESLLDSKIVRKIEKNTSVEDNEHIESQNMSVFKRKLSKIKLAFKSAHTPQTKKPLLEFALFKNFAFCALCMQIFLFTLSINITSLFLPALAKEKGVSNLQGAYLVSILGICDALCRIVVSSFLDLKRVKPYRLFIYNVVMFLTAIVSILLPSMTSFTQFAIVCGLYGMLSGTYISQKSVVIVDVVGVASLSSAFGFLMVAQGLSNLTGSTVGGMFKDFLGTYDWAFYFAAIGIVSGGLAMATGNIWLYRKKRRENHAERNNLN
ncbi:monocarboxylate transporter 4-like [Mercenaria mercenaria]|uniref:monocarboxylate transporter 4-like n=1 Tax=Mercenaria mercenaria TaxID=6596 RepID=UPI00234EC35C|nr:monocarboxylate transporter 4-like [Mercenaria mercenaria]